MVIGPDYDRKVGMEWIPQGSEVKSVHVSGEKVSQPMTMNADDDRDHQTADSVGASRDECPSRNSPSMPPEKDSLPEATMHPGCSSGRSGELQP